MDLKEVEEATKKLYNAHRELSLIYTPEWDTLTRGQQLDMMGSVIAYFETVVPANKE